MTYFFRGTRANSDNLPAMEPGMTIYSPLGMTIYSPLGMTIYSPLAPKIGEIDVAGWV